jgi:hypothetical protein
LRPGTVPKEAYSSKRLVNAETAISYNVSDCGEEIEQQSGVEKLGSLFYEASDVIVVQLLDGKNE